MCASIHTYIQDTRPPRDFPEGLSSIHTYIQTRMHTHSSQTQDHPGTCPKHTYIHTYIHTYTYAYTQLPDTRPPRDLPKGSRTRVLRDTTNSQEKTNLQMLHAKKKATLPRDSDPEHNHSGGNGNNHRGDREYANRLRDGGPLMDSSMHMDDSYIHVHTDSMDGHVHHNQDNEVRGQKVDVVVASVRPNPRDRGAIVDPVFPSNGQIIHANMHESGGTLGASMRPNMRERGQKVLPITDLTNTRKTKR
jgi:hypothetical protein